MMELTTIKPVITNKVAASMEFNYNEIKSIIESEIGDFKKEALTEDNVGDGKKICASLNKLKDKLKRCRIDGVEELLVNVKPIQDQFKELESYVQETHDHLKGQIDKFVEEQRVKKAADVELVYISVREEIELNDKYYAMIDKKPEYQNVSMSLTKVRKDVVEQFQKLKLMQDIEEQKVYTINAILEAYNDKLEWKYSFVDFSYLIEQGVDVLSISEIVKNKVEVRLQEEQEKREQIEREKQEAIERAKKEAEEQAKREAKEVERKRIAEEKRKEQERLEAEREKERLHQNELRRKEMEIENARLEAERKINQAKIEAAKTIQQTTETAMKYVPQEAEEGDRRYTRKIQIKGTKKQLDALKDYLNASGIEFESIK